jgi:hypothetical protein
MCETLRSGTRHSVVDVGRFGFGEEFGRGRALFARAIAGMDLAAERNMIARPITFLCRSVNP